MEASLTERIENLKRERNAVILAHNYQVGEVQDIADFTGDSLQLSQQAADTDADVIVFCGVHFMAETAAILSPGKTVLLPDKDAGCPMADMITGEDVRALKKKHPGAAVICYVNSTAEVKAESDCCCTSSNAVTVVNSFRDAPEILFVPDQYLGQYAAAQTGRDMIFWNGYCPTHVRILASDLEKARQAHPGAPVLAHPECTGPVRESADAVLSTGGMCTFVRESDCKEFIIATEQGMLHRLQTDNPGKIFHSPNEVCVCPNMKRIRLEKVLWALEEMQFEVQVPVDIAERARMSIERMLTLSV